MRVTVLGALAIVLLSRATPMDAQRPERERVNGREAVAGEVLVRFRDGLRSDQASDVANLADAESMRPAGRRGLQRVRSRSLPVAALIQRFANRPDVLYVEPNYIVRSFAEPNDASFPLLWGLRNIGQAVNFGAPGTPAADIHAVPAWEVSVGTTAQVVAVIDTGIDYTHPDLAANIWSAPSAFQVAIQNQNITCPAGSHGFNFIAMTCNPMDDVHHGTHVAGTIGASGNNANGVVGVNWVAQLMGIKFLDSDGSGTIADAIDAIDFAMQVKEIFGPANGGNVRVLSASWGSTDFSQALLDQINAANGEDMLFVAAAGNSSISNEILPTYPASYGAPNVISVAATTNTDDLAWFSNYGASTVHLGAPGSDILSTTPGNAYGYSSGTSMAAPHVSGAAALVLSRCALDTAALKDTLLSTVETVPFLAPFTITGGRLDVSSAIRSCVAPPGAPVLTALGGDGSVALSWTGASGALSFNVKRGVAAGGPYSTVATGVKGKSYTDTTVVNDTTYYYVVSGSNTLGEGPNSNEATATPKVAADLVVSALIVPAAAAAGSAVSISSTVRNQAAGTAGPTTTTFYLSKNSSIDASDVLLNGVHPVPTLPPGAVSTASVSLSIPPDTAVGNYRIVAKADADDLERETQESNNTSARSIGIGPDLVVSLSMPTASAPGGTIVVSDTVKNQGASAAGASTTRFYLSPDAALDETDRLLAESRSVPGLEAGASSTGSTPVLIPSAVATGSYYFLAIADADGAVGETQEVNNKGLKLIQVGGDLTVSALTVPGTAGAGSAIVVTDTVTNAGGGSVPASVTRFYLSTEHTLDSSATLLSESRTVPGLAAGASSSGSTTIVIPGNVGTGTYYLIALADGGSTVEETREDNNNLSRTVEIGGDLIVSALTVPASAGAGTAIVITETTKNGGAGPVMPSTTRFYLSLNSVLDASDVLLPGGRAVDGLAAGASSTGSTSVLIPSAASSGAYYVIAKADADGAAIETEESNNTAQRSLQIGGDLSVSALTVPAVGGAGLTLVVSDTTTNKGSGTVAASVTRFYLSTNVTFDSQDTLLPGGRSVPPLAAGANNTGSTTLTLPSPLGVARYYIIAKADGDGAIDESQESNNTLGRSIMVGPDLRISSLTVPFPVVAGSTVNITDVVQNQGGEGSPATTTRYFLSVNGSFDAGDIPLGSRQVPALGPGASSTGPTPVTIPAGTTGGYYYVIALADHDGVVAETDENNNERTKQTRVNAP
jgi:subtilisin family serine protease/subtilase family serine protease